MTSWGLIHRYVIRRWQDWFWRVDRFPLVSFKQKFAQVWSSQHDGWVEIWLMRQKMSFYLHLSHTPQSTNYVYPQSEEATIQRNTFDFSICFLFMEVFQEHKLKEGQRSGWSFCSQPTHLFLLNSFFLSLSESPQIIDPFKPSQMKLECSLPSF